MSWPTYSAGAGAGLGVAAALDCAAGLAWGDAGAVSTPAVLIAQASANVDAAVMNANRDRLISLPHFKDHKDPFDRLLVAQAWTEGISSVSNDT